MLFLQQVIAYGLVLFLEYNPLNNLKGKFLISRIRKEEFFYLLYNIGLKREFLNNKEIHF